MSCLRSIHNHYCRIPSALGTSGYCNRLPHIYGVYQVPPSPGAPLCCALYVAFCVGRYHQPLAPPCALCCFSCAAGTTSLWHPSVHCVSFLARQVPVSASGALLCSEISGAACTTILWHPSLLVRAHRVCRSVRSVCVGSLQRIKRGKWSSGSRFERSKAARFKRSRFRIT